ncbi:MAG: tape measure protein, partial [Solirubrobacteraceae bacterium]
MAADGELYVEIMPSTKGVKKQIESDLDGSFSAAESKGQGVLTRLGNGLVNFGKGVALTLAGVLAIAIKGGIDRQLKIEDAQAKLRGLGHDADSVKTIMTSALDAVKGTAYGLEEAATVAASAVAAGIKPGQELTKYLALTADAATIAGVSMGEMGAIINKVTSRGKADTEQLNQLAERGIPIFQWLADEYGVTQQELSKMVAQGKVDAETYRKVIEENIGGAALASGDTTRGAFKNMLAALSRLGVAMTSPAFGLFKTI